MPRKPTGSNPAPSRRRGAQTAVIDAEVERGLAMRIFLYSPKDMVAGALALAVGCAIIANALFLQAGRHPAPMFGTALVNPTAASSLASPLPRPRPVEADLLPPESSGFKSFEAQSPELKSSDAKPYEVKPYEVKPAEIKPSEIKPSAAKSSEVKSADPKTADPKISDLKPADPMTNLVKSVSAPAVAPAIAPRPPLPIPAPAHTESIPSSGSRRIAAVQRALTEYGYAQLKPTGSVGADTQAAIVKFEREHRLPVSGQVTDRLVRELDAVIGHPID